VTTELLLKPRQLHLEDLPFLQQLGHVEADMFLLERSPKGYKLKTPTKVPLQKILAVGQRGLVEYIVRSLASERPRLAPFILENQSLVEMARYFLRYRTGSPKTLYVNTDAISRYCQALQTSPDALISDVKTTEGLVDMAKIPKHIRALEDFVGELQDRGLAHSRIANYVKAVRGLYRVNGVEVKLPYALSRRSVRKDRAPKPEELQRLLDIADLREKVIVSMLALGGFREGTLVRLQYRYVKEDLEKHIVPVLVHVEAEITKGKYHDYDTFLNAEAVTYLRLYLDKRRQGSPDGKIQPEEISNDSPLIRDAQSSKVRPLGEKQVYKLIHGLYHKAGLLKKDNHGGYDLRVHSLRKFFKTQLMALGVQSDYIDYMMGHTVSTYHDIQSKGVEFLRNIYSSAGLSIKPRDHYSKIDMLKEMLRAWGLEPEKILTGEALAEPHRTYVTPEEREKEEIRLLGLALKESLRKDLLANWS
jgi:site-specific recombinase XerD